MSDYARILTSTSITINRIVSIMEQNGIQTLIKDNTQSGRLAGFGSLPNDVDLFVNKANLIKAQKLIEELDGDTIYKQE